MDSLACTLHTVVSAPRLGEHRQFSSGPHSWPSSWAKESKPACTALGAPGSCLEDTETCCSGGGNSPLSTERGSPCPRGGRHGLGHAVPGRSSGARGTARPCERLRLAGPGLEPGCGRTKPAPGAQGPEAPAVRPSASRTRAPGRGAAPGLGRSPGVARQASGEHLSTPGRVSSPPSVSSRGGESKPEEGSRPGPRSRPRRA